MGGWPLGRQIVAGAAVLVALGLLVAGVATTAALRTSLLGTVDAELRQVTGPPDGRGPDNDGLDRLAQDDRGRDGRFRGAAYYVVALEADGTTSAVLAVPAIDGDTPPELPAWTVAEVEASGGEPFTVDSAGPHWRVVAQPRPDGSGSFMVAASLADVESTLQRLVLLQVVIGAVVLVGLVLAGTRLVRRGLRPLAAVEATAGAIAGGDLARRVDVPHPGTEVGRLGQSFNAMVDQLQQSLAAQSASEAAARRNEARMRQFVADASHELRTPLTSVRGYAELYRMGAASEPAQVAGAMARIEAEATRMGVLVEDLLLLARLDAERAFATDRLDLRDVAARGVDSARAAWPGVRFDLRLPPTAVEVVGDADRLQQVVLNLVSNAQRHTAPGTAVEVTVRAGGGGAGAELVVRDHGPGVPQDLADRIFERFVRADASRARDDGGAGLGLAIVAAIAAGHGGTVAVGRAADGAGGAEFTVRLPSG